MGCVAPCPGIEVLDHVAISQRSPEWDGLLVRSYDSRIFLSPTWSGIWWRHFGEAPAYFLTLCNDRDELRGLLPLQVRGEPGDRVLSLAGDHNVSDYMDALAEKDGAEDVLESLWHCSLCEIAWNRVELRHVPSTSPLIPALSRAADRMSLVAEVDADEVCPVAILCSSWDGYLQMLTKKQRHEIRRKLRRAQEGADWEWRTARTHEDVERDMPVFFRLHEASAHSKADFFTERMRDYFRDLAHELLDAGILRLSVFRREDHDIAAVMSFLHRERYLLYNSGYDPEFASLSPGIAAVALAMQDAIEEKAVAFDFLSGDEPYKYQFGATNTYTCRITVART
jgi:CelD/BcsL family acetyltransferase involved in cellulose biosynthesis